MRLPWLLNHSDLGRKKRSGLIFRTKFLRMLKLERDGNIKASPVITRQTRELSFKLCSNAFFPVDLLALRPSLNQSETSLPPNSLSLATWRVRSLGNNLSLVCAPLGKESGRQRSINVR